MPHLSRRSFLGSVAAAGIAALSTGAAASAQDTDSAGPAVARPGGRIPHEVEEHRVLVVGSGFGGGVASLRLAQAGVPVVVLERGRRWPTGPNADTFPSATAPDARALWFRSTPEVFGRPVDLPRYTGLLEASVGENMTSVCATGVGGGSLIYQGMALQPTEELFHNWFPGAIDWREMDREFYPRVSRMLRLAEAPDELVESAPYAASRVFAQRVRAAGLPLRKIPMPIDWDYALAELRGEMRPSYTNGDSSLGVNNGGKHSVDVTYLAEAEATGLVDVRPLHDVRAMRRTPDGRWELDVEVLDTSGAVLKTLTLRAPTLILAAGSVGTATLLTRAAATGAVTDLPESIGAGWGTNADRIYMWTDPTAGFGPVQGGPVVYGSLNWSDPASAHTIIQASLPSFGPPVHTTVLVGYGVSADRGRVVYDAAGDRGLIRWPAGGDAAILHGHIDPTARAIVGPTGHLTDTNRLVNSTWHPLGGAVMDQVCDIDGRVLGQRGLYVVDGALIPGTTAACNPSLTIAAIAERALDRIVRHDVGTLI
ncbi:GMC oxidoreductase [Rhodococcus sp. IEGM 1408]|uniref:GMC oxidoreductase n=1 Tax=Rhodococcus sp. IEGM 1408 TaxID=3082220 RepID=UPI002955940D|nr:GMC oxidoreductase [Rhodococcus sp. IEGM 1408]MDV8001092.1 GMC oxidoreductase [Rhodococcus sp. IEGM 1408]